MFIPHFHPDGNPSVRPPSDKCYFSPVQIGSANHSYYAAQNNYRTKISMGITGKLTNFFTVFPFPCWTSNCSEQNSFICRGRHDKGNAQCWVIIFRYLVKLSTQTSVRYCTYSIFKDYKGSANTTSQAKQYFPEQLRVKKSEYRCENAEHPCIHIQSNKVFLKSVSFEKQIQGQNSINSLVGFWRANKSIILLDFMIL